MLLFGPIVVVSDRSDRRLTAALAAAGAHPIIETSLAEAAATIEGTEPAAVVFADDPAPVPSLADRLMEAIDNQPAPFMPVVARANVCGAGILDVLPIHAAAPSDQIVARLASALQIRLLHATVLRRTETLRHNGADVPQLSSSDPLEEATVLVAGRGRTYPDLTAAVRERVGLISVLSVENAARYLNARDVDGIILGDGFGPTTNAAFLVALMQDTRFCDIPIGVVPDIPAAVDRARLCGVEPVRGEPEDILAYLLPWVRVHAFATRLRRHIAALDARGVIDPPTGLLTIAAFERDLSRAIADARRRGRPMSIARFGLPCGLNRRTLTDSARLVGRLLHPGDFACQDNDGAIVVVFAQFALHRAHVVARRMAAAMRQSVTELQGSGVEAIVTLACLKSNDTAPTLVGRVCETSAAAG
jgi:hypothetical protein